MTAAGRELDLARLLGDSRALDIPDAPKGREHPLELPGMRSDHAWSAGPGRRVRLPTGDALGAVRSLVEQEVAGLGGRSRQAWAALLARPAAVVPLSAAVPKLRADGFDLPADLDGCEVHHVGLAVVVEDGPPGGPLGGARLLGTARVVVVEQTRRYGATVWAEAAVGWAPDAQRAAVALEELAGWRGGGAPGLAGLPHAAVIGGDETAAGGANGASELRARLAAAGRPLGAQVRWLPRPREFWKQTRTSLTAEPPVVVVSWLPPGGPKKDGTAVTALHRELAPRSVLQVVHVGSANDLIVETRDILLARAGVGHGLMAVTPSVGPAGPAFAFPPRLQGRIWQHDGNQRRYHEDLDDGTWWTKDDAQHGGSLYKQYRMVGTELVHEACCDGDGQPLPKHKGPQGRRIALGDLHAVDAPRS